MITLLIVITVVVQLGLTVSVIMAWRKVKQANPAALPKVFFVSLAVRLLFSLILFALGLFLVRNDIEAVKLFAVVFIAVYLLLLTIDTAYFYCSSQLMNNNKTKVTQ